MADGTINIDTQINSNGVDKGLKEIETKLSNLGSSIKGIGDSLTASISAPLAALGMAAMKVAADFDTSQARLQGQLGITAERAEELGEVAKGVWKKGFGEDVLTVTDDLARMKQQLGKVNDTDLSQLLESGYTLNKLFGFELNETTRTASVMMKTFGIEGQTAMDLITVAAQKGGDFSDELLDTLREYAPQFKGLGYNAEEFTAILVAGAQAGAFNLDKVGDAAKESFLRIGDGSKASREALAGLGLDFNQIEKDIQSGGESANSAFAAVASAIALVEDPAEKAALSIALFGTPLEDLGPEFRNFFATVNTDLGEFEGAAAAAGETLQKSFGEQLQSVWRETLAALQPIGDILLGLASQALPYIKTAIDSLSTAFTSLSPATQMTIVVLGVLAAALGPLLIVIGALITSVGTIAGALAGISAPVMAAIAVIVALGVTVATAYMQFEGFRNKVNEVFNTVKELITTALSHVITFVQDQFSKIQQFWSENGQQIMQAVQNLANFLVAIFEFCMPAIQFIVEYVWGAIKNVISGAIDIILGVIKTFSSLLTGDWGGLWEGLKQIVSGAIDLIIGWLSLTFVGGIRTLFTNLAKTGLSLLKGMWDEIAKVFTNMGSKASTLVDDMVQKVVSYFYGLLTKAKNIYGTLKTFGASTWEAIKQATVNMVTSMINSVKTLFANKLSAIKSSMTSVKTTITDLWDKAVAYLKGIDLVQIGKDIISGLVKGIADSVKNVTDAIGEVAGSIPEWAKKILGIHSPSRVMRELGEWTGIGLAEGIKSTEQLNQQMMKSVTDGILEVKKSFKDQSVKLDQDLAKAIRNTNEKANDDIEKIQKVASSKKRALTTDETAKIHKLRNQAAENILKLEEKAVADRSKLAVNEKKEIENKYKDLLDSIKTFVSDKKSLDQLSLKDEILVWEQSLSLFEGANDQRIAAQKEYKNVLQALNNEIVSINETYTDQINTINEDLIKKENDLTKAYEDAVSKRASSLSSFADTFAAFSVEVKTSGLDLLNNLQSQVDGFKRWQDEFAELAGRNIDADFLAELSDLGVKALPELMALNSLTDEQLSQYSALYQEKARLTREQAEAELIGLNQDTQFQIELLRKMANEQLEMLQVEWAGEIEALTKTTSDQLSSLKQIGRDAGQGLLNGLASMEGPLISKARQIANAIRSTIQKALDIHSPSRVMRGLGINIGEGLVLGMDDMVAKVAQSSFRLSDAVQSAHASLASSANRSANVMSPVTSSSSSVDNSRHFNPSVVIHTTNSGAKEMHRVLRKMAFGF